MAALCPDMFLCAEAYKEISSKAAYASHGGQGKNFSCSIIIGNFVSDDIKAQKNTKFDKISTI